MMKSDTDLDLVFKNAVGKKVILNIEEPKSGVTKAEIDAAMQTIVENNIFATTGGDIVEAVEGRLRTTTLDVVELPIFPKYSALLKTLVSQSC